MKQSKQRISLIVIVALLIILPLIAITIGRFSISLKQFFASLFPSLFPDEEIPLSVHTIIFNIRLPRILLALLAGAGLSVAGTAFQALFSNPLATPDTLGVATGASFGAVIGILFKFPSWAIQLCALAMGIIAVVLVYALSAIKGQPG